MQLTLTATFESVEELQDWVLKTAEGLRPIPDPVKAVHDIMTGGETVIVGATVHEKAPNLGQQVKAVADKQDKPKRKRRTKAEMAAARAAKEAEKNASVERAADGDVGDEQAIGSQPGNGKDIEPQISETELRRQYAEAFRGVLETRLEEGIQLVQGAGLKKFSAGTLEQQVAILDALGVGPAG